jgi:hypothetical protein
MYNSSASINSGNAMNFTNNSSSNQQFPQPQSSGGYQHQQVSNPQNNYHASQQQHPQLWTTEQQQNNYQQQPSNNNNNNGFNSNNITKGTDINNSNAFRGSSSSTGNLNVPQPSVSQQAVAEFNNQTAPPANQVGQQSNSSALVIPPWGASNHQNVDPNWTQNMSSNWQQTHNQNPLQTQTQPQQSSLQRTFDYVQQCQNYQ